MEQLHTGREDALLHLLEELHQQLAEHGRFALSDNRSQPAEERVDRN